MKKIIIFEKKIQKAFYFPFGYIYMCHHKRFGYINFGPATADLLTGQASAYLLNRPVREIKHGLYFFVLIGPSVFRADLLDRLLERSNYLPADRK